MNMQTTTVSYLLELRSRLIRCLIVVAIILLIALLFANKIYTFLALPLIVHFTNGQALIATAVPAPFLVPFKSALVVSIYIAVPYILHQLWCFVAPALYQNEKRIMWLMLVTSSLLFYLGTIFAYCVVMPIVFKFFIYVAPLGVEVKPDISQYLSFILKLFLAFGLSFEIPVVVVLLTIAGLCSIAALKKKRPYIIVGAFIFGMVLTPPDIISQIFLAVPMWILFEFGLWLSVFLAKKRNISREQV